MAFSWSYSKFKAYGTCPLRHYEVDIAKNYTDTSEHLTWGNEVHAAMADGALGKAPLPETMAPYQKWLDMYADPKLPGKLSVELKYAITKDFQPTEWFGKDVWMRGICDLQRVMGPVAIAIDYKTGKVQHDSRQLMLMAQCIFAHNPEVRRIKTEFIWLKHDCTTPEVFNRDTIMNEWPYVLDRVAEMEKAAQTCTYPPKKSNLCRAHCPVTSCEYNGRRQT